ncbi:hypothetical protein AB0H03_36890 [Streptomyces sparsogenes]|uniref:hypothetical protein n=1 Tax=Streptomyces sparsogenes TaxID=67365 RepID=UPI0033C9AEC5
MAEEELEARLTRIQAAARDGDAAARRAWDALIALVLGRDAVEGDLGLEPRRLVVLIEERADEDERFAVVFDLWMARYGAVAEVDEVDEVDEVHNEISGTGGIVFHGEIIHGNITVGNNYASRPPGPPFGDDDWGDETDDPA